MTHEIYSLKKINDWMLGWILFTPSLIFYIHNFHMVFIVIFRRFNSEKQIFFMYSLKFKVKVFLLYRREEWRQKYIENPTTTTNIVRVWMMKENIIFERQNTTFLSKFRKQIFHTFYKTHCRENIGVVNM